MEFHFENKNPLRSQFRLLVYENDNPTTVLLANRTTAQAISVQYPSIVDSSFRGWQSLNNPTYTYKMVISDDCMDWNAYEDMKKWAEIAGNQCIWLSTNKNTEQFFTGTELDFCVAYDWNFVDPKNQIRTYTGEAEYQMKWYFKKLSEADKKQYSIALVQALKNCLLTLPYDCGTNDFVVTAIPATASGQKKLAWKLAVCAAKMLDVPMISLTLSKEKPSIKDEPIENKVNTWREILRNQEYFSPTEELRFRLQNRNVLIVDDLYQSGASIWCLAEYLKNNMGVKIVQGATVVKSWGDGDNSWKQRYYS